MWLVSTALCPGSCSCQKAGKAQWLWPAISSSVCYKAGFSQFLLDGQVLSPSLQVHHLRHTHKFEVSTVVNVRYVNCLRKIGDSSWGGNRDRNIVLWAQKAGWHCLSKTHFYFILFFSKYSPWCNCTGWLGVKHQVSTIFQTSYLDLTPRSYLP